MYCFWSLLLVVVLVGVWLLLRRTVQSPLTASRDAQSSACTCGYPLGALDRARCPECGRVVNFDATSEDLGLTNENLERIVGTQRERAKTDQEATPPSPRPSCGGQ